MTISYPGDQHCVQYATVRFRTDGPSAPHWRAGDSRLPRTGAANFSARFDPLLDLQEQRDQFALAMRVRLGKDGFQLIARRLPGNL